LLVINLNTKLILSLCPISQQALKKIQNQTQQQIFIIDEITTNGEGWTDDAIQTESEGSYDIEMTLSSDVVCFYSNI
ncbi:unnamed protein product, partial [Rotaria sp. Silwood1]